MQCFHCGMTYQDGMSNCPQCGAPAAVPGGQPNMQGQNFGGQPNMQGQNFGGQPYMQGQPYGYPQKLSKKEFLHHPNLKKCSSNITASAITLYICAGISLILYVIVLGNFFSIVDVLLVLGLALGIHLAQSRVCAIIVLAYSVFNAIYMSVQTGRRAGTLIVIAAIYAVIATFQFQKAWSEYKRTGILPMPK